MRTYAAARQRGGSSPGVLVSALGFRIFNPGGFRLQTPITDSSHTNRLLLKVCTPLKVPQLCGADCNSLLGHGSPLPMTALSTSFFNAPYHPMQAESRSLWTRCNEDWAVSMWAWSLTVRASASPLAAWSTSREVKQLFSSSFQIQHNAVKARCLLSFLSFVSTLVSWYRPFPFALLPSPPSLGYFSCCFAWSNAFSARFRGPKLKVFDILQASLPFLSTRK